MRLSYGTPYRSHFTAAAQAQTHHAWLTVCFGSASKVVTQQFCNSWYIDWSASLATVPQAQMCPEWLPTSRLETRTTECIASASALVIETQGTGLFQREAKTKASLACWPMICSSGCGAMGAGPDQLERVPSHSCCDATRKMVIYACLG